MPSEARMRTLEAQIEHHNRLYYEEDRNEISDSQYDALTRELRQLEAEYPELASENSPTKRVGGEALRSVGVLVAHKIPMLSMQDVFDREAVLDFVRSSQETLGADTDFLVESKIDGLSLSLRYENGRLTTALTRGDGVHFGEDVTLNAKAISDIPHKLKGKAPAYLELRGEVYMRHEAFFAVNAQQELLEKKPFANPRNCAAGTLRQKNSKITKERQLSFFCFNLQDIQGTPAPATHAEVYDYLQKLGCTVIAQHRICQTPDEVWEAICEIDALRGEFGYEIDGAVVKVNHLEKRKLLKDTSKHAGYQIAYKYPPERKESRVLDIALSVGRTGKITPTAVLEPIYLSGTTVSRAILHNQDFLDKHHIGIGSTLLIEKSGEIIPKCIGEVECLRPANLEVFQIPAVCPVCGSEAKREEDGADMRCQNPTCPAQIERWIRYFVGRDAMDMKGFGEVYIRDLIAHGYLHDVADLFLLWQHRDDLIESGLIGKELNTDKLLAVIEQAKTQPVFRLLTGLGIPNIGKTTAKQLMAQFGSLDALSHASLEDLQAVRDIGLISAQCLLNYFQTDAWQHLFAKFQSVGLTLAQEITQTQTGIFSGKTFVLTGTLSGVSRETAVALIEAHGGKVKSTVSKKTDYVLAGEEAGSKLQKAKDLAVPILDWDSLQEKISTP